jgi:hypothetical protein
LLLASLLLTQLSADQIEPSFAALMKIVTVRSGIITTDAASFHSQSLEQDKQKAKKESNNLHASHVDKEQHALKKIRLCDMRMAVSAVLIRKRLSST